MGRYANIHRCIWNDDKFPFVSDDCQLVFFHLMTTPMGSQFGLFKATIPGLAAEKRWSVDRYAKAFQEAFGKAFVKYDERHQLVYLPQFMKYNKPNNPNVLRSWGKEYRELPDCDLKTEFYQSFKAFIEGFGEGFKKAFQEGFGEGFSKNTPGDIESEYESVEDRGVGEETMAVPCLVQNVAAQVAALYPEDGKRTVVDDAQIAAIVEKEIKTSEHGPLLDAVKNYAAKVIDEKIEARYIKQLPNFLRDDFWKTCLREQPKGHGPPLSGPDLTWKETLAEDERNARENPGKPREKPKWLTKTT